MTPIEIGVAGIICLLILLMLRVPVGISMIVVSIIGNILLTNPTAAMAKLGIDVMMVTQNYSLSVIPLFILMGLFLTKANLGADLYEMINYFMGRKKGGMAVATVAASGAFAAVCGSVVAAVSTISAIAVPEMKKYDYDPGFSASVAAVGSAAGVVIPPSTALVLYGVLTEESIGQVMIGGILPGIITIIMLMITVVVVLAVKPKLAPGKINEKPPFPWKTLKYVWAVPVIFLISMGGIYGGIFTPTEAGSVGAFLSLVFAICTRRMKWKSFLDAIKGAVRINAMVFIVLLGGVLFGAFLTRSLIPLKLSEYIQGLDVSPFIIILVILLVYTAMGPFMDEMATLVIMTPIVYPIVISLGYNGIWFGVMTIMMLVSGLVTPPVGIVSLVAASITKVPAAKVFISQWPFWITMLLACVLFAAVPDIALLLPNLMYK